LRSSYIVHPIFILRPSFRPTKYTIFFFADDEVGTLRLGGHVIKTLLEEEQPGFSVAGFDHVFDLYDAGNLWSWGYGRHLREKMC
jgi:hypothetical protein